MEDALVSPTFASRWRFVVRLLANIMCIHARTAGG